MKRALFVVFSAITLSGCMSTQTIPIGPEHETRVSAKSMGHAYFEKGSFAASSPGSAAFGLVGAVAAISEGTRSSKRTKWRTPRSR